MVHDEDANMEVRRFGFSRMVWHRMYASTLRKIQITTLVKNIEIIDHYYLWTFGLII
jgi:hypothetical protein